MGLGPGPVLQQVPLPPELGGVVDTELPSDVTPRRVRPDALGRLPLETLCEASSSQLSRGREGWLHRPELPCARAPVGDLPP